MKCTCATLPNISNGRREVECEACMKKLMPAEVSECHSGRRARTRCEEKAHLTEYRVPEKDMRVACKKP